MAQLSGVQVLFEDQFSIDGTLNSADWKINRWSQTNNSSWLGQTQIRQSLPVAEGGVARIRLDTWLDGSGFSGSEAITNKAWDLSGGGVAFEGRFRFESSQAGMIAGFFAYQAFEYAQGKEDHDELDFEILTSQLAKISTNVFLERTGHDYPQSIPITGSFADWHVYRIEWLPDRVRWLVDGQEIRVDMEHVPTQPQNLHMNLWGVPTDWGPGRGDPNGPSIGNAGFVPAGSAAENKTYYFDVDYVKVEQLSTYFANEAGGPVLGADSNDVIYGGIGNDIISGFAGADIIQLGGGADILRDSLANLHGDSISGFGVDDVLDIDQAIDRKAVSVDTTEIGVEVSVADTRFRLVGDFSQGNFMTVARNDGTGAKTLLSFVHFLPDLQEAQAVDPIAINGIANEPYLVGDGATSFAAEIKSATSSFHNTLGVYTVDADGTIGSVRILFADTLNVGSEARTVDLDTPADGARLAFFLVQDGFGVYGQLPDDLSLVTSADADAVDGGALVLRSATLGNLVTAPVFHSIAAFNPNGAPQVLSGVDDDGLQLLIGFEDLPTDTGDNDFQDVILAISVSPRDDWWAA